MKRGFTLIELLIVVAIIAILATAVVLVLNPIELLGQARDSQRMSDLNSVKSAIALYLSTANSPSIEGSSIETAVSTTGHPIGGVVTVSTSTAVDGTGWVRVDLADTSGGSTLTSLPIDPINSGTYFYAFRGDNASSTYKLASRLESSKYREIMATDRGSKNICSTYTDTTCFYEIGTELTL